jgi:site-specific DNA-methyltransferase (adenine-specific)
MNDPYYAADGVTLHLGDSLDILPTLADNSVDAVVCDPPYGLSELAAATVLSAIAAWMAGDRTHVPDGRGFMGREWDRFVPPPGVWDECLRVLKPGGHLLAFAGSRTVDLMTLSIRIAGFEIRDSLEWIYGSGMPKSLDVSKAIDKAAGAKREVIGHTKAGVSSLERVRRVEMGYRENLTNVDTSAIPVTAPATEDAKRWEGWGTALKPSHEPIVLARKPLTGTVVGTVLAHGTGALNIDGCRTPVVGEKPPRETGGPNTGNSMAGGVMKGVGGNVTPEAGRWPTNVVLIHPPLLDDHGQPVGDACADGCVPGCPVAEMDRQSGVSVSKAASRGERHGRVYGGGKGPTGPDSVRGHDDEGGASRFFPIFRYEAKAPASERPRLADGTAHPTVKPLALMQFLVRLVTPPGGIVLDPFAGSGTTLSAALREGKQAIGIEQHEPYAQLAVQRLAEPYMVGLFDDIA